MNPICPDCKHPVDKHDEFFCMQVNCRCNQGKVTAMAKYERDVARKQLEVAITAMTQIRHETLGTWVYSVMRDALDEIKCMGGNSV